MSEKHPVEKTANRMSAVSLKIMEFARNELAGRGLHCVCVVTDGESLGISSTMGRNNTQTAATLTGAAVALAPDVVKHAAEHLLA